MLVLTVKIHWSVRVPGESSCSGNVAYALYLCSCFWPFLDTCTLKLILNVLLKQSDLTRLLCDRRTELRANSHHPETRQHRALPDSLLTCHCKLPLQPPPLQESLPQSAGHNDTPHSLPVMRRWRRARERRVCDRGERCNEGRGGTKQKQVNR